MADRDGEGPGEGLIDRALTRALGHQLHRARDQAGLTQPAAAAHLGIHPKTYATYEQGIRQCTVPRLAAICAVLGVTAADLVARAVRQVAVEPLDSELHVDLQALVRTTDPVLRGLRRWARRRLDTDTACTMARLAEPAVAEMAVFVGIDRVSLVRQLERFAPDEDGG